MAFLPLQGLPQLTAFILRELRNRGGGYHRHTDSCTKKNRNTSFAQTLCIFFHKFLKILRSESLCFCYFFRSLHFNRFHSCWLILTVVVSKKLYFWRFKTAFHVSGRVFWGKKFCFAKNFSVVNFFGLWAKMFYIFGKKTSDRIVNTALWVTGGTSSGFKKNWTCSRRITKKEVYILRDDFPFVK